MGQTGNSWVENKKYLGNVGTEAPWKTEEMVLKEKISLKNTAETRSAYRQVPYFWANLFSHVNYLNPFTYSWNHKIRHYIRWNCHRIVPNGGLSYWRCWTFRFCYRRISQLCTFVLNQIWKYYRQWNEGGNNDDTFTCLKLFV